MGVMVPMCYPNHEYTFRSEIMKLLPRNATHQGPFNSTKSSLQFFYKVFSFDFLMIKLFNIQ